MSTLNRSASSLQPLILGAAARRIGRTPRFALSQRHQPAVAILIPQSRRLYATEPPTSQSGADGGDFPPPGFNAEEAKKPLEKSEGPSKQSESPSKQLDQQSTPTRQPQTKTAGPSIPDQPLTEPTAEPKTAKSPKVTTYATDQAAAVDSATAETNTVNASNQATATAGNDKTVKAATSTSQTESKSAEDKAKDARKLTIWQKVKKEANHYWDGTKLLGTETRISFKLALKMAAGYELTRREHRQFHRTVRDLGRLVPFSVFVIVPFAELLLPVALKLFPNLLPSTYEGQKSRDAKATSLRKERKEVSNFLRQTLKETGLPITSTTAQRTEFVDFFRKVRNTGEKPSTDDVIKVCKIFRDDLTLDNLSRPQLVGMCRYMNLNTFGTDAMLRYHIRHRMRQIKTDDRAISYEGVDSLSVTELHTACASRGLRTQGLSPGRLRDDLQMWLDCRLKYNIPSTLLVLSNAFVYAQGKETELSSQIDALQAVLASVPEELFHEIELEVHNAEGAATNKQRLEVLKEQQELIEEENEQGEQVSGTGAEEVAHKDNQDIDDVVENVDGGESVVPGEGKSGEDVAKMWADAVKGETTWPVAEKTETGENVTKDRAQEVKKT